MSFTMCSSEAIIWKAGANVNSTIAASGAFIKLAADEAESFINSAIRINETDEIATMSDKTKWIFSEACSEKAAITLIKYDMGGYNSREEALSMIDVSNDIIQKDIALLRNKETTTFVNGA